MSNNELAVVKINSLSEIEKIANSMVKSRLFGGVDNFDQAFSLMMVANARGIHPVKAAMDYHIIQGKPALKADAMLAYFQESGGIVQWKVYTDTCVIGLFSHPRSGQSEPLEIEWTIEMASKIMVWEHKVKIPLSQKEVWKNYPRAMLRSRCISEGVRTVYPGIISGFYTEEEVSSFTDNDKFNKAKPVEAQEVYHTVMDPEVISVHQAEDLEEVKGLRLDFTETAKPIKEKLVRLNKDVEAQLIDDVMAADNLQCLIEQWYTLCHKYTQKSDLFVVPQQWAEGMHELLRLKKPLSIQKGYIDYGDDVVYLDELLQAKNSETGVVNNGR